MMFWIDVIFQVLVFVLTSLLGIPIESFAQQFTGG